MEAVRLRASRAVKVSIAGIVATGLLGASFQVAASQEQVVPVIITYGRYVVEGLGAADAALDLFEKVRKLIPGSTAQSSSNLTAAQNNDVGLDYLNRYDKAGRGDDVDDLERARAAFVKARLAGSTAATTNLGVMYYRGDIARLDGRALSRYDRGQGQQLFRSVIDKTHDRVAEFDLGVGAEDDGNKYYALYWYHASSLQGYRKAALRVTHLCSNDWYALHRDAASRSPVAVARVHDWCPFALHFDR